MKLKLDKNTTVIVPDLNKGAKRRIFRRSLVASLWESAPILLLSFLTTSAFYGRILTTESLQSVWIRSFVVAGVVALGWLAGIFKKRNAMTYGVVELCIVLYIVWFQLSNPSTPQVKLAVLFAGVYLVSRAFQNIRDGFAVFKQDVEAQEQIKQLIKDRYEKPVPEPVDKK